MMAAIFLVLAVLDTALLTNVLLANTRAGSVSVLDQPVTGFTQGQLLLLAAGLGLLLALSLGIAWSSSSARRLRRRELRADGAAWRPRSLSCSVRTPASAASWSAPGPTAS
jgi:hypothetical protein